MLQRFRCVSFLFKPPWFDKCHYDIIFGKVSFKAPLPRRYTRKKWNYKKANV